MSRLIDADKLIKDVLDLPNCENGFSDTYDKSTIIAYIDEQPTVEAEPIVRCRDCKWYVVSDPTAPNFYTYDCCRNEDGLFSPRDDDYCSVGEKRWD